MTNCLNCEYILKELNKIDTTDGHICFKIRTEKTETKFLKINPDQLNRIVKVFL